jgi:superoxide dismutase, Fe-Mn family
MESEKTYSLPDLPYATDALEPVISKRIMELHHGTHHASYVKAANLIIEELRVLPPNEDPSALERALSFNVSGHRLHSLFWQCMAPGGKGTPSAELKSRIEEGFGDVEHLKVRMSITVEKLAGSGWAALVWEPTARRLVVAQIHDHQHDQFLGGTPILVIDGWEHAYYLQYEAARAKWAVAFWNIVDWDAVSNRLHDVVHQTTAPSLG